MRTLLFTVIYATMATAVFFAPAETRAADDSWHLTTSTPFVNIPTPEGERWDEFVSHWKKRESDKEVDKALQVVEEIAAENDDTLTTLWLCRATYMKGMRLRGEEQKKVMRDAAGTCERITGDKEYGHYAKYWRWSSMIYYHEFTDADYKEIRAFGRQYEHIRELPVPDHDSLWQKAINHWDDRYTYEEGIKAIGIFQQLEKKYPNRIEPKLWLLRANYWMHYAEDEEDKKAEWLFKAANWGWKACEMEPRNPAANYLTASALGQYGSNTSFLNYIRYAPEITKRLMTVLEEDPNYFYGGVSQYFALAIARAGTILEKMLDLIGFEKEFIKKTTIFAANYEPRYLRNWYALGEMYLVQDKKDEAKKMLEKVVNGDPTALKNMEAENRVAQKLAKDLLEEHFGE